MDPQQTWTDLVNAVIEEDEWAAHEAATNLLRWMQNGGFPPQTLRNQPMPTEWNRVVTQAVCRASLRTHGCGACRSEPV